MTYTWLPFFKQSCCTSGTQAPVTKPTSTAPSSPSPSATVKPTPKVTAPKPVNCLTPVCSKPQTCQQACPKPICCKRFNDMIDGCPRVCFQTCAQVCPRRCCGPHPPIRHIAQRPKINDIPQSPACPKICADVCALECPHRCCGPGSLKRSFVPRASQLAYMKNNYAYATRRFQVPIARYSKPRGLGLKKKRHAKQ